MMDPYSLRPPARRRRGREGDQAVLKAGNVGSSARAPSEVPTTGVGGGNDRLYVFRYIQANRALERSFWYFSVATLL